MRQSFIKKSAAVLTAGVLTAAMTVGMTAGMTVGMTAAMTVAMAPNVYAASAPLYSFDYDGHHIDTYASYSMVDGKRTDGFRYFVKDGNLVVVDNDLNPVADGMFMHYDSGDSYIATLTGGGRLVSMGTVDLPAKLKNFTNKNIDSIASNVEDDTHTLIVNYNNGATVAYDVLTGEELFRTDAQKDATLASYIKDTLSDLLTGSQSSSANAKKEAEAVINIMNNKGYSLEQLLNGGVFSSEGKFKEFIETGKLTEGGTGNAGSTQDVADVSDKNKSEAQKMAEAGADPGAGLGESGGEEPSHGNKADGEEAGGSSSAGTDIESSYTVTAESLNKNNNSSGSGSSTNSKSASANKNNVGQTGKTTAGTGNNAAGGNSSGTGSVVFVRESTGEGKTSGTQAGGEKAGGKSNSQKEKKTASAGTGKNAGTGAATDLAVGAGGSSSEGGAAKSKNDGSGDNVNGTDKNGSASVSTGGNGTDNGLAGAKDEYGKTKSDSDTASKDKRLGMKSLANTDYVSVYNADTEGYDIYSVAELMENPEAAKSENEKLGTEDNNKIAQLLSVKEDETSERGLGLYVVVIAGIVLLLTGVLLIIRNVAKKGEGEA